ncbi:hypothetical protein NO932_06610 [Pelagibacterium sp. 26DY04]|uniref:hypothetical protein n=1 Tax=Pelagibacterium sp. 26DY04 TaxID=2967130 RepID=UPI002814BD73|nr:hypothetical protein [Pelagibacterium sp. 26DY04]WMT88277.1 hypothetical protein NO932_06610 [Pelagibacterium sp. 26DY04]
MPAIAFPPSTAPSINPTENGGRLINAYAEKAPEGSRGPYLFRRAPGLEEAFEVGSSDHRGAITIGSVLYVLNGDTITSVTKSGSTYSTGSVTGTVTGSGRVIMARNMRSPDAQVMIVHDSGISLLEAGAVADFSDPDLPGVNSVTFQDGYFFFTTGDGRCFASGINDTTINELDYVTAESSVDGLVRGIAFGRELLLMGETTTEFWGNTGNAEGFPFSRGPVISVGLFGRFAVTGHEYGFPAPLAWVGNDKRIYRLNGYAPEPISTPHIDRLLAELDDGEAIEANCFVSAGHACYVFSGPTWTLVYDTSTGTWHERKSYGADRWRTHLTINAFNEWLALDRTGSAVLRMNDRARKEGTQPLVFEVWSSQAHRFPGRAFVKRGSFDFVTGVGKDRGISPIETEPRVSIAWSDDGGRSFGNDLVRSLGTQGEIVPIDVFRCGLTGRHGRQWRLKVSDPVEVSLLGGAMDIEERLA